MIRYLYKDAQTDKPLEHSDYQPNTWVYVEAPTEAERSTLLDAFKLDQGALRDALDENEIPRLEQIGDRSYIFVRFAFENTDGDLETRPLLFVLSPKLLITISPVRWPSLDVFLNGQINFSTAANAKLVLQILQQIAEHYDNFIRDTSQRIKHIRTRLRGHDISNQDFIDFATIEDALNGFLSALQPTNVTLRRLMVGRYKTLFKNDEDLFEDLLLNNDQSIEACHSTMKSIGNIRKAYRSISSNNLNHTIKILTVATVMIAVPNLFYGMYGMNVELPFQHAPWAYSVVTLFTLTLVLGVYAIGRRKKIF